MRGVSLFVVVDVAHISKHSDSLWKSPSASSMASKCHFFSRYRPSLAHHPHIRICIRITIGWCAIYRVRIKEKLNVKAIAGAAPMMVLMKTR